ncbi:polyprenyl diphosphate synthase [Neptunicella marina]|uniref:Ditrans,polycis-undecaprenyl-diphosphate synthase ((2E,6E)-farnesyl-diphosphate specific) n=1 Tax=Neptunicella marina TaxID=2125989 RepID=A0A8J6LVW6_9ALTE|nr:polyprenyl diphosphate synthase [Neptunicella marina]MBC3764889.1 di-trans,poly-cis-decaprenylcistransferase [Neptunicella marina]
MTVKAEQTIPAGTAVPDHVAIIMDGNGRWAKSQGKRRTYGHKAGVESVRAAVRFARENGIKYLTLFAFSSENWNRPQEEVSVLMELFTFVLKSEVKKLNRNDVRLNVVGDTSRFGSKLQALIQQAEQQTKDNQSLVLNIAANYGGRWDIVNAARQLAEKSKSGEIDPHIIDETLFNQYTSLYGIGDVDLLIRTGGDCRVSNFLLWQLAYAELVFMDVLWPDFGTQHFAEAVEVFSSRQRRFGKTGEQIEDSTEGVTC